METPVRSRNKEENQEPQLGSFYRLKSYRKLAEKKKPGTENSENQNEDGNTIFATPEESEGLEPSSPRDANNKIMVTPNPFIRDEIVQELLNDLLDKYRDKVQIISFGKQPQLLDRDFRDEVADLEEELNSKLQIGDDSNATPEPKEDPETNGKTKLPRRPVTEKKEYFVCRNKPRRFIGNGSGALAHPLPNEIKIIAENEYWMVVEFQKNSTLFKKHGSSRILTQKRVLGNPVNCPPIQSIEEYKVLHAELKRLLEMSNYCYSPDLF
ncbi:hypothetical protein HWI79_3186 [Cryptosporidium felis]|nr:hypothetical protein HWI79_3186 [Cryptosporidium felis]